MTQPPPPPPSVGPPPPGSGNGLVVAGFAVLGAFVYICANAVLGFMVFLLVSERPGTTGEIILGVATAAGVLTVFVGGGLLIRTRNAVAKGLGLGLMIGWALVTICTVGLCTGVNPDLYAALTWPASNGVP
ncbi:hypothetical protein IU447_03425 [Nocardia farcinica]|uniref:hypothetical protein n=1 Tax=Nocardia farcinica TaxID=37329 RepID=UPI0018951AB4|nr:hypothetical protein [Nocardia farcinica]MBF6359153.1 hypothetical protein [Nocardia farcinica]